MHTEASEWMVISNIPASLRDEIALIIAGFPETTRVEPVMLHTTSNAWARWITQSYKGATLLKRHFIKIKTCVPK